MELKLFCQLHDQQVNLKFDFTYDEKVFVCSIPFLYVLYISVIFLFFDICSVYTEGLVSVIGEWNMLGYTSQNAYRNIFFAISKHRLW